MRILLDVPDVIGVWLGMRKYGRVDINIQRMKQMLRPDTIRTTVAKRIMGVIVDAWRAKG